MNLYAIGRNIRHYRRLREWSQHDLAKATNLTERYIERLEDGAVQKIHPLTVEKIADSLVVSLDELLSQDEPPEPPPPLPKGYALAADVIGTLIAAAGISFAVAVFVTLATILFHLA